MVVSGTICVIGMMGKGISFVSGTCAVNESDVIVSEHKDVLCNASIYLLGAVEVLEVFVVSNDDHLMARPHEEVMPVFKSANDGEELPVPDGIVSFGGAEGFRVVSHWAAPPLVVMLPEDGAGGFLGGVHFEFIRPSGVGLPEDQVRGNDVNEGVNCRGALISPDEVDSFLEKMG